MTIPDTTALTTWLNDPDGGGDRLQRNMFIAKNRKLIEAMREIIEEEEHRKWNTGLPAPNEITAMQVAVFDNWPRFEKTGEREPYKAHRWGLSLQAWTCRPESVVLREDGWQRHYIGNFKSAGDVLDQANKALNGKHPITLDYYQLIEAATKANPGYLFAMLEHKVKGDGTIFPEQQFVMIEFDEATNTVEAGWLMIGHTPLPLPPFSKLDITGSPYSKLKPKKVVTKGGDKRAKPVTRYTGVPLCQSRYAVSTPNNRFRTFQTNKPIEDRLQAMREKSNL